MKTIKKTIEVDEYVTSDGKIFAHKSWAEQHERDIEDRDIIKNLSSMELEFPIFGDEIVGNMWYLVSNKKTSEYLFRTYCGYSSYLNDRYLGNERKNTLKLGDWVAVRYKHGEDGKEKNGLISLSYAMKEMNNFIAKASKNTVDGMY